LAVWQGFGLAGYGTDTHAMRIGAVIVPLLIAGFLLVWPKVWIPIRVLAVLLGFVTAGWAWWEVRSSNLKSAMSLHQAVEERDRYREQLASATFENFEEHLGLKGIRILLDQYPTLTKQLSEDYTRWQAGMTEDILARYDRTQPDDFKTVAVLRSAGNVLGHAHPPSAEQLDTAFRKWLMNTRNATTDELQKQTPGDWAAFNRTSPNRQGLVKTFSATRDSLAAIEEEWVNKSVESMIAEKLAANHAGIPPRAEVWRNLEKDILALKALDATDERFKSARKRLFELAHTATQREITAHLEAKRYALMFGTARKHALEWDATAKILGPEALKKIDTLRAACQPFSALAEKAPDEIEVAPEPRSKP
jgi:hypothetical protein